MASNYPHKRVESKAYKNFIDELMRIKNGMQVFHPVTGVVQRISTFIEEHNNPLNDSREERDMKNFANLLDIDRVTMHYLQDDLWDSISWNTRSAIVVIIDKLEDFIFEQVKNVFFTFREDYTLPLVKEALWAEFKELKLDEMTKLKAQIKKLSLNQSALGEGTGQRTELQSVRESQEKQSVELKRKLMKKEERFKRLFAPMLQENCSESDIPRELEMLSSATAERIKQAAKECYIRVVNNSLEGSFTNFLDRGQILLQEIFGPSFNLSEEQQKELIVNIVADIDSMNKNDKDKQSHGIYIQIPYDTEKSNYKDYDNYLVMPHDWETINNLGRFYYGIRSLFVQWDWVPTMNGPLQGDPEFSFKVIRKLRGRDRDSNLEFNANTAPEDVSRYMKLLWAKAKEHEGALRKDYHLFCNAKSAVRTLAIIFMKYTYEYIDKINEKL